MAENENGTGQVAAPIDADYAAFLQWKEQQIAIKEAAKPKDPEWYVHTANGDVHRLKESEFPKGLHRDHLGHYVKDGYAHTVIGVYPVETRTTTDPNAEED